MYFCCEKIIIYQPSTAISAITSDFPSLSLAMPEKSALESALETLKSKPLTCSILLFVFMLHGIAFTAVGTMTGGPFLIIGILELVVIVPLFIVACVKCVSKDKLESITRVRPFVAHRTSRVTVVKVESSSDRDNDTSGNETESVRPPRSGTAGAEHPATRPSSSTANSPAPSIVVAPLPGERVMWKFSRPPTKRAQRLPTNVQAMISGMPLVSAASSSFSSPTHTLSESFDVQQTPNGIDQSVQIHQT